jgi:tagatose-6-phosphate ketose/aldose isomerase
VNTNPFAYSREELEDRGATHTAREISQQPGLWREVADRAAATRDQTDAFVRGLLDGNANLQIVLTGAGTSAFAGEILAPALTRALRRPVSAVATTDIVSNPRACFAVDTPTLLVSFARSGDSPESVAAVVLAEQCLSEVHHLIVTCNAEGELYRRYSDASSAHVLLMPAAANDQGFAMTSSFTCMMLAAWLALAPPEDPRGLVERLAKAGENVLGTHAAAARAMAERTYERIIYLGSGPLTGLARESALKILELTAGEVVTYFDSALGFRHGPKSVLNDRTLVIVYLSNDAYTRQYDFDILREIEGSLGWENVVAIGTPQRDRPPTGSTWAIDGLADADDAELAVPAVVCAQLIGLSFSLALGRTPDNPFPSGEVNRVVQGVTIHSLTS